MKKILKRLFNKGHITKEIEGNIDFDRLTEILKERSEGEKALNELVRKKNELEALREILKTPNLLYSEKELNNIFDSIINSPD